MLSELCGYVFSLIKCRYHVAGDELSHSQTPSSAIDFNASFTQLIEGIKRRHDPVVTTLANGILELKSHQGLKLVDSQIQSFLDRFYMSRIGIRMLIGQHIALQQPVQKKDYVGIICTKTNICEIAQDAIDNSRFICEDHYGLFKAPVIQLHCPRKLEYVRFIIVTFEFLISNKDVRSEPFASHAF